MSLNESIYAQNNWGNGASSSGRLGTGPNISDEEYRRRTSDLGKGVDLSRVSSREEYNKESRLEREKHGGTNLPTYDDAISSYLSSAGGGNSTPLTAKEYGGLARAEKKDRGSKKAKVPSYSEYSLDTELKNLGSAKNNPGAIDTLVRGIDQQLNQYAAYRNEFDKLYGERTDLTDDDRRRLQMAGLSTLGRGATGEGLDEWVAYGKQQQGELNARSKSIRSFLRANSDVIPEDKVREIVSQLDAIDADALNMWQKPQEALADIAAQRKAEQEAARQQELYAKNQKAVADARQSKGNIDIRLADIDNTLTFGNLTPEQRTALNNEKQELLAARREASENVKIAEGGTDWNGRQELIDQYQALQGEWVRLQQSGNLDDVEEANRIGLQMQQILQQLREGDLAAGNGERVYSGRDRVANVAVGTAANLASSLMNAAVTTADATMQERAGGREQYEWDLADDFNRQQLERANAENPEFATLPSMAPQRTADEKLADRMAQYNDQPRRETWDKLYAAADSISDAAQHDLQAAKEGLSELGKAGVDIAQNVIEMGFDAAVGGAVGGALVPMFIRTFGGSAQEARRAGASLDEQNQYGGAKALIEVATEKMFDGVANIYGAGAADEITEALIGKLADSDVGRTFLRVVFSGAGEGVEEVISSLLSPLAESLYKDDSIGNLYRQIDPADVLYDFIIGATIGALGSGVSIANGQNAQANFQLRLNDSGVGDVRSQAASAMDVLSGRITAGEETARQALNKARLADDIGGQNAVGGMNALEDYVNQRRLSQYDNVTQATPAAEQTNAQPEPTAPLTPEQAAEQEVRNALSGTVTDSVATRILTDPALREALGRLYPDLNLRGLTNSQARNAIKGLASQEANNASLTQDVSTGEITQAETQTGATEATQELNSNPTPTAEVQTAGTATATVAPTTLEARRAEVQSRLDEINNLLETETDPAVIDGLYAEGDALLKESQTLDRQIEARDVQQSRIDNGEVSVGYGTPKNHIDNRTGDDMTSRKVKAFQFDHPELHGYFVDAAKALIEEVQAAEMQTRSEMYSKGSAVKGGPVRTLMDNKLTKPRILQCLNDIIANNGQENYADAKRVERVLSDMMSEGWTGMNRQFHEANADYIAAKEAITGAVKSDSWEKYYSDRSWMVDTGDATEEGLRAEWEAQQAAKAPAAPAAQSPAAVTQTTAPAAETEQPAQAGGVPGGVPGGLAPWNTTTEAATNGMGNKRERNMTRNLGGNENAEPALSAYFRQNKQLYSQLTNNEVAVKAEAIIGRGFDSARDAVYNAIGRAQSGMKLAPEYAVAGYELANEMSRRGDLDGAAELCSSIAAELSYAGQLGQIGRLILNTPAARIRTVEKLMERLNDATTKGQRGKISKRAANVNPAGAVEAATAAKNAAVQMLSDALNNQGTQLSDTIDNRNQGGLFDFPGEAAKRVADSIKAQIKKSVSPNRQSNTLDTFVNYVKRFAREKVGNIGQRSTPMTATEFLREVVNNEDLMREVYERAQAEFSNENASGYRDFVEDFVNTPMGLDASDERNKIFTRAIAESALAAEENNARYVREQEALGVPRGEIASRIAQDLITKTGATGAIADSIRNAAEGYVSQIVMGGELTSEEQVNRLVNNVMRTAGERFSNLAIQDGMTKEGLLDAIANDIATAYALSPESAERVADTVANEYDRLLGEAMQKELERRFKPKEKQARQMKDFGQQLTEAINLGAFNSEYAQNAITKLFGASGDITISPELLENYANAANDEAANEALEAIKDDIAAQIPATFHDKFIALRYLNMLGNLKTQGRNIIGNTAMMIATDTKRTVQAVAELAAAAISGGNYERTTSLTTDAGMRKQARDIFEKNVQDISGEAKYSDARRQASRDIQNRVTIFGSGESSRWASDLLSRMLGREVDVKKNVLEDYRLLTNWAMEAGDEIFMRHTFTRAYAGWMKAHGVSDINNATQEQQNSAYEFAKKEAQEATFHDSNKFSDAVSSFGRGPNTGPLMRVISEGVMPFRKTPANVAVRAVEYSPLGAIKALWDITGRMGNRLATDKEGNAKSTADIINEASKSLTGSALFALGYVLAATGRARASGDDDDENLNFFHKMQGAGDYSVRIGDKWVSLSQFAPMSIPFFMGVKLNDLWENGMEDFSVDDIRDIFGVFSEPMLEMSMLSGVNDLFEDVANLSGDTGAIPGLIINSSLSYLSQGLTNSLLGQLEQAQDENRMTTYVDKRSEDATAFDKFVGGLQYKLGQYSGKVPVVDYHQEEYIDAWGRTQSNGGTAARYFNALLNPTYITGDRSTEVDAELERLHTENRGVEGFPEVLPQKRGRSETIGDNITLTPEQYRKFSIESGQKKLELVSDFMGSEEYANLSDRQRADVIRDLYTLADDLALHGIKASYGVEDKTDTAKLLAGSKTAEGEKVPALKEENLAEYIMFNTPAKDAERDKDYSSLEGIYSGFGNLDQNTRDVLAAKDKYAKLLVGTKNPDPTKSVPALKPENLAEYAEYEDTLTDARNNRDYAALDRQLADYGKLDSNIREIFEKKGVKDLDGMLAFTASLKDMPEAGSPTEAYFNLKDSVTDAKWLLETDSSQSGHVKLAGLAMSDLPTDVKDQLVDSGAYDMSGTAVSTYDVLRDYGKTSDEISNWFENADWYSSGYDRETGELKDAKSDGSLNVYEVAVGISQIEGLTPTQKDELFQAFKAVLQNPKDLYDTWKNKSYTQALGQASNYGRIVGKDNASNSKDDISAYLGY